MRTKQQLVLVDNIRDAKISGSKDENERLHDTVKERNDEDEDGLRVDDAVIDHRRSIELSEI